MVVRADKIKTSTNNSLISVLSHTISTLLREMYSNDIPKQHVIINFDEDNKLVRHLILVNLCYNTPVGVTTGFI